MKCTNCGHENKDGVKFCSKCGNQMNIQSSNYVSYKKPEIEDKKAPKKKSKAPVIIIALVLVIALLSAAFVAYIIYDNRKDAENEQIETENRIEQNDEDEKAPEPEGEDKEEPESVEEETQSETFGQIDYNGYATYYSEALDFRCKYPSYFNVDESEDTYFACSSADGMGQMLILGTDDYYLTVEESLNDWIASFGGTVEYKVSGDSFFAARTKEYGTYYYTYAKIINGKMYSFSFEFPEEQFEEYDSMINYVYADFVKQF